MRLLRVATTLLITVVVVVSSVREPALQALAKVTNSARIAVQFVEEQTPEQLAAFETTYGVRAVLPITDASLISFTAVDSETVLAAVARDPAVTAASRVTPLRRQSAVSNGNNASLKLSSEGPDSFSAALVPHKTVAVGQVFPVSAIIETDGAATNSTTLDVFYDPAKFQLVNSSGVALSNASAIPNTATYKGGSGVLFNNWEVNSSNINTTTGRASITLSTNLTPSDTEEDVLSSTDATAPTGYHAGLDRLVTLYFKAKVAIAAPANDNIAILPNTDTGSQAAQDEKIIRYADWASVPASTCAAGGKPCVYIHAGVGNAVVVGDTRLVPSTATNCSAGTAVCAINSVVVASDTDIGNVLAAGILANVGFTGAGATPAATDPIYVNNDYPTGSTASVFGTVTTGDTRLVPASGNVCTTGTAVCAVGSTVAVGDTDISSVLKHLNNVRQTDSGGSLVDLITNNATQTAGVKITTTAATVSAANSTVAVSPSCLVAGTATTVTVTAKDAGNLPISGATVTLAKSPSSSSAVIGASTPSTTNSSGQVTFSITDAVAETVTFTATINGTPITQTAVARWDSGTAVCTPDASQSRIDASPNACVVTGANTTVTVTLRNASGTLLTNSETVTLIPSPNTSLTVTPATTVTTSTGTATFTVSSSTAQSVTFTATATGPSGTVAIATPTTTGGNVVTFAATCPSTFSISGSVTGTTNAVTITRTGTSSGSAVSTGTSTNTYSMTGLSAGTYTLTPSAVSGCTTPAAQTVTITSANQIANFAYVCSSTPTLTLSPTCVIIPSSGTTTVAVTASGAITTLTASPSTGITPTFTSSATTGSLAISSSASAGTVTVNGTVAGSSASATLTLVANGGTCSGVNTGVLVVSLPQNLPVQPGSRFTLPLQVSRGAGIGSFALSISFDPNKVTYIGTQASADTQGFRFADTVVDATGGRKKLVLGGASATKISVSSPVVLANLMFSGDASATGTTTFTIENATDDVAGASLVNGSVAFDSAAAFTTNDPLFKDQWWLANNGQSFFIGLAHFIVTATGLDQIFTTFPATAGADIRWTQARASNACAGAMCTGSGVTVAVVDTGVDASHPDLQGQVSPASLSFDPTQPSIDDSDGHGTFIAGLIAASADNGAGIVGIAPQSQILAVKDELTTDSLSRSIRYAAEHGASVINLSVGGSQPDAVERAAIDYVTQAPYNAIVVASAGNAGFGSNPVLYPASFPHVISVGAIDPDGAHSLFSEMNSYVDVSAPGGLVTSLEARSAVASADCRENGSSYNVDPSIGIVYIGPHDCIFGDGTTNGALFTNESGTSFSAPMVAGAAALAKQKWPTLTSDQFEQLVRATADDDASGDGYDPVYGAGTLNVARLLAFNFPPEILSGSAAFTHQVVTPSGTETTQLLVKVNNMEGSADITTVTADLSGLGLGASVTMADTGGLVYSSPVLTIPSTLTPNQYPVTVTARDAAGGQARAVVTLQVFAVGGQLPVGSSPSAFAPAGLDVAVAITRPSNKKGRTTQKKSLPISGTIGADVAFVDVNGDAAEINATAHTWGALVKLKDGKNRVVVKSYDVTRTSSDEDSLTITKDDAAGLVSASGRPGLTTALEKLRAKGVVMSADRPNAPVTRAEFAKMLVLTFGRTAQLGTLPADVPVSHSLAKFITTVEKLGWASGNDGRFYPDQPISRLEAARMLLKAAGWKAASEEFFKDLNGAENRIVTTLRTHGVVAGVNGRFEPFRQLTRSEAATILIAASSK